MKGSACSLDVGPLCFKRAFWKVGSVKSVELCVCGPLGEPCAGRGQSAPLPPGPFCPAAPALCSSSAPVARVVASRALGPGPRPGILVLSVSR